MLNKTPRLPGEARLIYEDATFEIQERGDFVVCAVTGKKIPLADLKYWSVDLQQPYVDGVAANERMIPLMNGK